MIKERDIIILLYIFLLISLWINITVVTDIIVFFFLPNIRYSNSLKKKVQLCWIMVYNFSHRKGSVKQDVLNFTGNDLYWSLFLIKLGAWRSATLLKRHSTHLFSSELCENFKNTYFKEHIRTIASLNFSFK